MMRIQRFFLPKQNFKLKSRCIELYGVRNVVTLVNEVLTIKEMPHPTSLPFIDTKLNFLFTGSANRLHEYIDRRHQQLGPIFYENMGGNKPLVFISDPMLMKTLFLNLEGKYPAHILPDPWVLYEKLYGSQRGLFFMNGEEWLTNRRAVNKHLLREESDKWLDQLIKEAVFKFIQKWKSNADQQSFTPDLETELYRLSTDVIIHILQGTGLSNPYFDELISDFSEEVKKIFQTTTKLYGLPVQWLQWLSTKQWRDFHDCVNKTLQLAQKIINEILTTKHKSNGLVGKLYKEGISDEIIKRIAADFVIAAGDTSAYTTLWTLLLLSKSDSVKEDIRTKSEGYVKNVIKESMRLYPVAPFLTRILPNQSVLGTYSLEKGTPIIASIYTSGRDEQNFSRAKEFLPFRWDRNDPRKVILQKHVPSGSLPFAHGSRSCVGKKIAMLQLSEIIKQIVHNFDFKCLNSSTIKPITSQVLIPDEPLKLVVSFRKQ